MVERLFHIPFCVVIGGIMGSWSAGFLLALFVSVVDDFTTPWGRYTTPTKEGV